MSFVFRGTRADIESGYPGYMPDNRSMRVHAARPVNSNPVTFFFMVLILFLVLNTHQMASNFLVWLVLGVFLMASLLRMYAACRQLQIQAQAPSVPSSGMRGHTELRLHVPPSIAFTTRGRLHGLRLQLALLDREFDDLDYETLRALDSENSSSTPSMTEEEINALPVHKYRGSGPRSDGPAALQQPSSSSPLDEQKDQDCARADGNSKTLEDGLNCSVCLEQVKEGEIIRSLPCLHQFHTNCIDQWLRQQGTCPVCKYRASSGWQENGEEENSMDASYIV